ncbi:MAG: glycosyltransferase, partial [Caulobacterales bacterium]
MSFNDAADATRRLNVILADPSLFTGPYDSGLTAGLAAADVDCRWVVRPLRAGERADLPTDISNPIFYRGTDRATWAPKPLRPVLKGFSHIIGWARLLQQIRRQRPDIVHFQWTVLPIIDAIGMLLARRKAALVLTVHDATPYNGDRLSILQRVGFDYPIKIAQRVIVHTQSAAQKLSSRGCDPAKIRVVPHGPLTFSPGLTQPPLPRADSRFTFVLFGQLKPYKGLDVLVEALALTPPEYRKQMRIIIAGAPMMNMSTLLRRIAELDLRETIDLRLGRLPDDQMARLFQEADSFVFPYRQIDASGVYYLVRPLKKWMI